MPGQKLPPPKKYYLCVHMDMETSHGVQCSKSRACIELIYLAIGIHSFEHKYVNIKRFFQW